MSETAIEEPQPVDPTVYIGNGAAEPEHKIAPEVRPEKKIAIFGTTPSRMEGPFQDDSGWERWTIGPGGKDAHNWERLFEVHGTWPKDFDGYLNDLSLAAPPKKIVVLPQPNGIATSWAEAIANWKRQHGHPDDIIKGDWSAIVEYPRKAIEARFIRRMWFTSSIGWCIALAIEEGATDIGLWGIDLESGEEYISQFVGCAHLLDLARLAGINLHMPKGCGLLRDPAPYPDRGETLLALTLEKKVNWIGQNLRVLRPQYESVKAELHRREGRLLTLRELNADPKLIEETEQALLHSNIDSTAMLANVHQLEGEVGATNFYRRMFVWGVTEPDRPPQ